MQLTSRDLNAALWAAADEMRKVMSADVYKDYLLGLVFYKALSDKMLKSPRVSKPLRKRMRPRPRIPTPGKSSRPR